MDSLIIFAEIDLALVKQYGVPAMFAAGLWLLFGGQAKALLAKIPRLLSKLSIEDGGEANPNPGRSSDQAAPSGFGEHVDLILSVCGAAPEKVQIQYLRDALSESDTLRRENKRMVEEREARKDRPKEVETQ